MRHDPIDFVNELTPAERTLVAHLAALIRAEASMPEELLDAIRDLDDWVEVDVHLVELALDHSADALHDGSTPTPAYGAAAAYARHQEPVDTRKQIMAPDELPLTPKDRALLAQLRDLTAAEAEMPEHVALAATAAQGWADVDAELAALMREPVLTRGDGAAYSFAVAGREIRVEVEPAGYRRRRLNIVLHEAGGEADTASVRLQRGDGEELSVPTDRFGERSVEVGVGPLRVLAGFASGPVTTGWFTI